MSRTEKKLRDYVSVSASIDKALVKGIVACLFVNGKL
jgi:hypothetical protein